MVDCRIVQMLMPYLHTDTDILFLSSGWSRFRRCGYLDKCCWHVFPAHASCTRTVSPGRTASTNTGGVRRARAPQGERFCSLTLSISFFSLFILFFPHIFVSLTLSLSHFYFFSLSLFFALSVFQITTSTIYLPSPPRRCGPRFWMALLYTAFE